MEKSHPERRWSLEERGASYLPGHPAGPPRGGRPAVGAGRRPWPAWSRVGRRPRLRGPTGGALGAGGMGTRRVWTRAAATVAPGYPAVQAPCWRRRERGVHSPRPHSTLRPESPPPPVTLVSCPWGSFVARRPLSEPGP